MSAVGCRECRSEEKKEAALTNVVVLVAVKVWMTWLGDKELWHANASGTSFRQKEIQPRAARRDAMGLCTSDMSGGTMSV